MIEVELKARVNDYEKLKKKLDSISTSRKYSKNDIYYKNNNNFIVRIRDDNSEKIVTFKFKKIEDGIEISEENEFSVSDSDTFAKLLQNMNFYEYFRKIKTGYSYKYNGMTLDFSSVNDLGWFLEIEQLIESSDGVKLAKNNLLEVLRDLNLDKNLESRTYEELILEK